MGREMFVSCYMANSFGVNLMGATASPEKNREYQIPGDCQAK